MYIDQAPDSYSQALRRLREAVAAVESARDRRGHAAGDRGPLEPAKARSGWSVVDGFESNGRQYAIVRVHEARPSAPRPLSPRERQLVALARLGHSSKIIAYELGLADSTVRVLLRRAAKKLGMHGRSNWSRAELDDPIAWPAPVRT